MVRLLCALIACTLLLAGVALAHDHWINRGNYKSPIDGTLCCGENDCFALSDNDVRTMAGGYLVMSLNEFVPFREVLKSMDGHFWRCTWPDGKRRCFFAPSPNA